MGVNNNPAQVIIRMKRVVRDDGTYYFVGNCNMDISILETALFLYPPKSEFGTVDQVARDLVRYFQKNEVPSKEVGHMINQLERIFNNYPKERSAQLTIKTTKDEVLNGDDQDQEA